MTTSLLRPDHCAIRVQPHRPATLDRPYFRALAATIAVMLTAISFVSQVRAQNSGPKLAPVQLSPERRQLIGLQIATVKEEDLVGRIDTTGLVEPDEGLQGYVQTRFAGWIRQVFVNQTYQLVKKGQPLFTIYSPDLVSTENEYLIALHSQKSLGGSSVQGVSEGAQSLISAALDRLKQFGVPSHEIARLQREGTTRDAIEIVSPMSGYVVERNALPNMYAQPDTFIWEALDPMTRTAKVRCSFANSEGLLKLGMYVAVAITPRFGRGLVIPDTGVFRTGEHNIVFVDRGDGYLTPTEVELGAHLAQSFQVLKGLSAGQRIVSSANFLVDSESQLQAAAGTFVPPPPGVSAAAGQPQMSAPSATIEMSTDPNPAARGKNKLIATLKDAAGKPLAGAQVSVTYYMAAMPSMGMAAIKAQSTLTDEGNGTYSGTIDLQSGGTWQATITATKDGQSLANKQFDATVSGPMAM